MNKQSPITFLSGLALAVILILPGSNSYSHPGSLDINGGHYFGNSYHCHMTGCEAPDTFSIDRRGRDSLLTDYRDREKFFNEDDWSFEVDFDEDCQSTRQEMLVLTSRVQVGYTNPRNCVVRTGEWFDEYTGKTHTSSFQVDIDHVIPRLYAHTHGGDRWSPQKKMQFANDPMNLMVVDKNEIRRKRDNGPDRYLPREEFQCQYVRMWEAIADKYDLQLGSSDRAEIGRVMRDCPEQ